MNKDSASELTKDVKRKATVLVCDDDPDTRTVVRHLLAASGFDIEEAEDGKDAIDYCKRQLPDVIVLDVMMPGITGTDFVKWLRAEIKDRFVPVLMLTALTEVDDCVEGLQVGADDYISKPFNSRELVARVEALLRIKNLTEGLRQRTAELREANEQLSKMQDELVAKERGLVAAELAGAASHELRQPVTSILLNCHLIERTVSKAPLRGEPAEAVQTAVKDIRKECDYMNSVLARMASVDPNKTMDYIDDLKIVDFGGDKEKDQKER